MRTIAIKISSVSLRLSMLDINFLNSLSLMCRAFRSRSKVFVRFSELFNCCRAWFDNDPVIFSWEFFVVLERLVVVTVVGVVVVEVVVVVVVVVCNSLIELGPKIFCKIATCNELLFWFNNVLDIVVVVVVVVAAVAGVVGLTKRTSTKKCVMSSVMVVLTCKVN